MLDFSQRRRHQEQQQEAHHHQQLKQQAQQAQQRVQRGAGGRRGSGGGSSSLGGTPTNYAQGVRSGGTPPRGGRVSSAQASQQLYRPTQQQQQQQQQPGQRTNPSPMYAGTSSAPSTPSGQNSMSHVSMNTVNGSVNRSVHPANPQGHSGDGAGLGFTRGGSGGYMSSIAAGVRGGAGGTLGGMPGSRNRSMSGLVPHAGLGGPNAAYTLPGTGANVAAGAGNFGVGGLNSVGGVGQMPLRYGQLPAQVLQNQQHTGGGVVPMRTAVPGQIHIGGLGALGGQLGRGGLAHINPSGGPSSAPASLNVSLNVALNVTPLGSPHMRMGSHIGAAYNALPHGGGGATATASPLGSVSTMVAGSLYAGGGQTVLGGGGSPTLATSIGTLPQSTNQVLGAVGAGGAGGAGGVWVGGQQLQQSSYAQGRINVVSPMVGGVNSRGVTSPRLPMMMPATGVGISGVNVTGGGGSNTPTLMAGGRMGTPTAGGGMVDPASSSSSPTSQAANTAALQLLSAAALRVGVSPDLARSGRLLMYITSKVRNE